MRPRTKPSIILVTALAAATLVGCSPSQSTADDGVISIVASTNVYGEIASQIGGNLVEVTSIIDDPSQDPHSFEADARVQLALSKADIVVQNGGGYDEFVEQLLDGVDVPEQVVISAVEVSPLGAEGDHSDDDHDHGAFNEHVWYDFSTVAAVASSIRDALVALDPDNADGYDLNTAQLQGDLDLLGQRASAIGSQHDGTGVAITEPLPLYLLEQSGLHNRTPAAFSSAIEGGTEVSAAVLNEMFTLFRSHEVELLVYNDQTTSPETEALLAEAERAGIPVLPVTELLPQGDNYTQWMNGMLDDIEAALRADG